MTRDIMASVDRMSYYRTSDPTFSNVNRPRDLGAPRDRRHRSPPASKRDTSRRHREAKDYGDALPAGAVGPWGETLLEPLVRHFS